MEIIDGHMHLWTPETHPWLEKVRNGGHFAGKFEPIMTYLMDDYLADMASYNITKCVYVQALMPDPIEETRWLDNIAEKGNGMPHGIVGYCDLSRNDVDEVLGQHAAASKRIRGIRQMLDYHPDFPEYCAVSHDNYFTDVDWIQGYGLLEKYQMSFDLQALPRQLKRAADAIRQYPSIKVVVNHAGFPVMRDETSMKLWREGLLELSRYPNVYCKASGVGMFAVDPTWDQFKTEMIMKPVLEYFGVDRVIFASNFPVDKLNRTFSQLMESFKKIMEPFTVEEQRKVFAENAKNFYRL